MAHATLDETDGRGGSDSRTVTELRFVQEENKEVLLSMESQVVSSFLEAYITDDVIVEVEENIFHFS